MPEWNWRAVCEDCLHPDDDDAPQSRTEVEDWVSPPRTSESQANIQASTHNRRRHDGSETADVREVDG